MTWLMDDTIHPDAGLSLAEMTVEPGALSECHRHGNCNEIIYLTHGQISQRIGDIWIDMKAGDRCVITKGQAHQTRNTGSEAAQMILVYSEGQRKYEKL